MMKSIIAKPLAALCLILAIGAGSAGFILSRQSGARYQAAATVQVQTDLVELGTIAPKGTDIAVFLQNEIELLHSETFLQKVLTRLNPDQAAGKPSPTDQPLGSTEAIAQLQANLQVLPEPIDSRMQIRAASTEAAATVQLANTIATTYCEYVAERRRHIAEEKIQALAIPYKENEGKVQAATAILEQARQDLAPSWRDQNPPPQLQAREKLLSNLQRELSRATMVYMAQSNKLVLSRDLPTNSLQKLETQVEKLRGEFTNTVAAVAEAARQQEGLRKYWLAHQSLEKAEALFTPYQKSVEAIRRNLGPDAVAPAVVTEPATAAVPFTSKLATITKACLFGAGGFFLVAVMLFLQPQKSRAPVA